MEYALQTDGLTKCFRGFRALDGLAMHVPKGSIYGFVGRNGAGKTTLFRLICGMQRPTSGSFELFGISNGSKDIVSARRRIGAIIETPALYGNMTAAQNLKQQALIHGLPSFNGIPGLLKLVGLDNAGNKKAKDFSLGMKQRLGIAIALVGEPDFLNPHYVRGLRRTAYGILHDLNPCGQAAQLSTWEVWHPIRVFVCNLMVIAVSTALGCLLFDKKEIK